MITMSSALFCQLSCLPPKIVLLFQDLSDICLYSVVLSCFYGKQTRAEAFVWLCQKPMSLTRAWSFSENIFKVSGPVSQYEKRDLK